MVDAPHLPVSPTDDGDTLAAAIVRAARGANPWILLACTVLGALGVPMGWVAGSPRVLLLSAALAVGAFGAGGLSDRILADERRSTNADRTIVTGFSAIRGMCVVVGGGAAIAFFAWILFWFLGSSRLTWH